MRSELLGHAECEELKEMFSRPKSMQAAAKWQFIKVRQQFDTSKEIEENTMDFTSFRSLDEVMLGCSWDTEAMAVRKYTTERKATPTQGVGKWSTGHMEYMNSRAADQRISLLQRRFS